MRVLRPLLGLCLLAALPNVAASQDIRDCPLDQLLFIDPWGGAEFTVDRVAGGFQRYCYDAERGEIVPTSELGEDCRLLGDLHLIGTASNAADQMVATYSVIWGAPCCGWSFASFADVETQDLVLLHADEMLSISEAGIYPVMESDGYTPMHPDWPTQNPLIPTICRPALTD